MQSREKRLLPGKKVLGIRLPRIRDCECFIIAWIISILVLVLQRDLGTSLFDGLFVAMLYVATDRVMDNYRFGLFTPAALIATEIFPHVGARFNVWWNAFDNALYNQDRAGSRDQSFQDCSV